MKKNLILLMLCCVTMAWGQGSNIPQELRDSIAKCDSIIDAIGSKKDTKIEWLQEEVRLYRCLDEKMGMILEAMRKESGTLHSQVDDYAQWVSSDTLVFYQTKNKAKEVPPCLRHHWELIENISLLRVKIEKAEQVAHNMETRAKGLLSIEETNERVGKALKERVDEMNQLINQIKQMGYDTLSEQQYSYLKGLVNRYNNFSKYYE